MPKQVTQAQMLINSEGDFIPQVYNPVTDQFEALEGQDGATKTQLTGRNVENDRIYLCQGLSIADTQEHRFAIDTSLYEKFSLYAYSTIDSDVSLNLRINDFSVSQTATPYHAIWNGSIWDASSADSTVLRSGVINLLNTYFTYLDETIVNRLQVDVQASTAPTTGSINVYVEGVRS